MDEYTRVLLKDAFDLNDFACEQFTRLEERTRQAAQAPARMIHKTYEGPQPQQQVADLSPVAQQRFDAWLDRRVREHLTDFADCIGEETGLENEKLHDRISRLEAETELLRGRIEGRVRPIKGKTDAA